MKNIDPRVDAYIEKSADFARPILTRIRTLFHKACPAIQETIKWGIPYFEHKGLVGGMAAFKQHVSFGFWKSRLMSDPDGLLGGDPKASMCNTRFTDVADMPGDRVLIRYIKEAVSLNERAVKFPTAVSNRAPKPLVVPDYFLAALKKNKKALATFEDFTYSYRKDYVEWITQAKRDDTRKRRIATALQWLAEGKPCDWKYMKRS